MKNKMNLLSLGALTLALTWMQEADATATCFCKISKDNLEGHASATGVCKDLTGQVATTYSGIFQQSEANQVDCNGLCASAIAPWVQNQSVANACCAIGTPTGTEIYAYSAVGTKVYRSAPPMGATRIGVLIDTPAVTETKCPGTWLANLTNMPGGVTADGKCKKLSGPISITPLPANGTPIGTYGFTWGGQVYAWGTPANGGAAVTITVSQGVCSF